MLMHLYIYLTWLARRNTTPQGEGSVIIWIFSQKFIHPVLRALWHLAPYNRRVNASLLISVFCFVVKQTALIWHRIEYLVLPILEGCPIILLASQYIYITFGQSVHIVPFISAGDCRYNSVESTGPAPAMTTREHACLHISYPFRSDMLRLYTVKPRSRNRTRTKAI